MKIFLGIAGLLVVAGGFIAIVISMAEGTVGLVGGKLRPCPDRPNCVGSQEPNEDRRVEPIPYQATAKEAKEAIRRAMEEVPRSRLAAETEEYLHYTVKSSLFRFVDDVEFLIDEQKKVIHVRSASRIGYSDMGVNRSRVEDIRARLAVRGIGG